MTDDTPDLRGIAIVGLAGRFPAAPSVGDFWRMLREGREGTRWLTDEELLAAGERLEAIQDPAYVKAAMILPDMEMFDAGFFGFTPREAAIMDPQHRHFLECCWEALEDAGHAPHNFKGSIGVFGGCGMQAYMAYNLLTNRDLVDQIGMFLLRHTGNDKDFLTTRVSYLFDLHGPSIGVQTACSTSLVAVHLACESLTSGESDMALAGGVSIDLPHGRGYRHAEGEILSSNGHCRAFDDKADGTLFGSGTGVVVLRRLEDAVVDGDHIYAVIRGSAVNNDGAGKAGYLAPSVEGQARAAAEALAMAEIEPKSIDYIEAHGTGTLVGDPIELVALDQAYRGAALGAIRIGSVKTNVGHLDTAAGVASLIKVVLSLKNETLPRSLNFSKPNTRFDFAASPFRVAAEGRPWLRGKRPRRAGVNSLGVGGTNAHVIVEEAPLRAAGLQTTQPQIVTLSAKTPAALDGLAAKWAAYLKTAPADFNLANAAFTTQVGRQAFAHRLAIAARGLEDLLGALETREHKASASAKALDGGVRVVFMFPGGGAQYPGAGRDLYARHAVFKESIDACFAAMPASAPANLKSLMLERTSGDKAAAAELEKPLHSILAVFVIEYALGNLWKSWDVEPAAVIGHSAGEYAAAALTGVMSLKDALATVTLRGDIFERAPAGGMLLLKTKEGAARALAAQFDLDIAVVNGPELVVVSGPNAALETLAAKAKEEGVETSRIRINVAAHSRMLDAELPRFRAHMMRVKLNEPKVGFVSNLDGRLAKPGEVDKPDYWVRHLREAVRFGEGVRAVLDQPGTILLEVGPGQALSALVRLADGAHEPAAVIASARLAGEALDDEMVVYAAACALWANGFPLAFKKLRGSGPRQRMPLPTYAFEKQRHWIEPGAGSAQTAPEMKSDAVLAKIDRMGAIEDWMLASVWTPTPLNPAASNPEARYLVFAGDDAVMSALLDEIAARRQKAVVVQTGAEFAEASANAYVINPAAAADYASLLSALSAKGHRPTVILHGWALAPESKPAREFDSVFLLAQAMQLAGWEDGIRLMALSEGGLAAKGVKATHPERAALLGPCRVLPRETPGLTAQWIDIAAMESNTAARMILAEADVHSADAAVALHGGQRLVQTTQPQKVATTSRLRPGGVYVITGGLGGVGRALAEYLAKTVSARLALIGRSAAPAGALSRFQDLGGEAIALQADVTNMAELAAALEAVRARFGTIHGIFHAAGCIDDAPIAAKTLAAAHQVMAPKIDGVRILDELLPEGVLDVFAVFSSTSALVGPPGQADYVGANAVLDAVAGGRRDGLSIAWGVWADIGMAARIAESAPRTGDQDHPLLGVATEIVDGVVRFEAAYDASTLWPLAEHRVGGHPILPGSAYLEIVNAVARKLGFGDELSARAINFLAPLGFETGQVRRVRTTLSTADDGGYRLEIESRRSITEDWTLHCEANLTAGGSAREVFGSERPQRDLLPPIPLDRLDMGQRGIDFGPRWRSMKSAAAGDNWAAGEIALGELYHRDLGVYRAHPALLDIAGAVGLFLIENVGTEGYVYAPISILRFTQYAPLPAQFRALARYAPAHEDGLATFDLELSDVNGSVLMALEGFTFRRVDRTAVQRAVSAPVPPRSDATILERLLAAGIRAKDADAAFARVLSADARALVMSSIPLAQLRALYASPARKTLTQAAQSGSDIEALYANATEARIARMICDILGVESIKPEDEFLAFGGGSLAGIRLFARIRREMGVDLALSALFQAPTLRQLAVLVLGSGGGARDETPEPQAASPSATVTKMARKWSPLVRIAAGKPGRRPLFCMHGAGGNVVNFKPIADRISEGTPFYGLQAQGVDGRKAFQETVEEMAQSYIAAIQTVDPIGPYRLAGYSGGGVVAYEMAQRIVRSGRKVELIVMFDTLEPADARTPVSLLEKVKLLPQLSREFALHWPQRRLAEFLWRRRLRRADSGQSPDAAEPAEIIGARAWDSFVHAQMSYEAQPYYGDVLLFRATNATMPYLRAGRCLGWDKLVSGDIQVVEIAAWHETVFQSEAIEVVADALNARLDALDQRAFDQSVARRIGSV